MNLVERINARYLGAGVILVAVLAAGVIAFKKIRPVDAAPETPKAVAARVLGPADAPVEIVEYSDFQCPACREASRNLKKLAAAYPRRVRIEFHHFPLSGHPWSPMAHQAAECANEVGSFWPYHDKLYDNQPKWSVMPNPLEAFLTYARDLGLNLDAFGACMADEKIGKKIAAEKAGAKGLEIISTPTFFINGQRVVGGNDLKTKGDEMIRKILNMTPARPAAPKKPVPAVSPSPKPSAAAGAQQK